jgi:hypothetical protein
MGLKKFFGSICGKKEKPADKPAAKPAETPKK